VADGGQRIPELVPVRRVRESSADTDEIGVSGTQQEGGPRILVLTRREISQTDSARCNALVLRDVTCQRKAFCVQSRGLLEVSATSRQQCQPSYGVRQRSGVPRCLQELAAVFEQRAGGLQFASMQGRVTQKHAHYDGVDASRW
jgi:hypothetical protein